MGKDLGRFIEPSASGPTQKIGRDGVITPGTAHEAKEGRVLNPGVRTISSATSGPVCPVCGNSSLKMRMNRKAGERIYCSSPGCTYDQSKGEDATRINAQTNIVDTRGNKSERGVKIIRGRG